MQQRESVRFKPGDRVRIKPSYSHAIPPHAVGRVEHVGKRPGTPFLQGANVSITTTTHLNLRGDARAALDFYRSVFGGEVTIATYADFGMPAEVPGADNVVFGQLVSDAGFRVMAYDIPGAAGGSAGQAGSTHRENGTTVTDQPFFLSVRGETLDEVEAYWKTLSVGASIVEPLAASAWSPGFGMLTDSFGVTWILDVAAAYNPA